VVTTGASFFEHENARSAAVTQKSRLVLTSKASGSAAF
jgi:hypothetical protein